MIGKVNDDFFQKHVLTQTGTQAESVVIGPHMGVDAAILRLSDSYMAVAEDPIFPSLSMTADDFAFVTVHIGASDIAVMGIQPRYMTYSLLLPPDTEEDYIAELIAAISRYAKEIGITIVGGHTGFYGAVTVPTIGGITVWGTGDTYISPMGAQDGDNVIITKGCGVEAAALLSFELQEILKDNIDTDDLQRSLARMHEVSVVKDACIAAHNRGVHAMHDATEGGVKRGVWEIAQASGKGVVINTKDLLRPHDIEAVCGYFNLNTWEIISEGTLVLTCAPETTEKLLNDYEKAGIKARIIGTITKSSQGCMYLENGDLKELVPPSRDKFWDVFFEAAALHANKIQSEEEKLCAALKQTAAIFCDENIYKLLPEIGANIACVKKNGKQLSQVAGIPGRIICVKDTAVAVSEPEMGASVHMGESILEVRKYFPEAACIMNLRKNNAVLQACDMAGLTTIDMPPCKNYQQKGNEFLIDLDTVLAHCDVLPDILTTPDRINLETLILVIGTSLIDLERKVLSIKKNYKSI